MGTNEHKWRFAPHRKRMSPVCVPVMAKKMQSISLGSWSRKLLEESMEAAGKEEELQQ